MYNPFILTFLKVIFYKKVRVSHVIAFTKYNSLKKMANFLHATGNRLLQKPVVPSKPYLINSEPTNRCFLKCPFCPTGKTNSRKNGYADPLLYEKIYREIAACTYLITFHGWGEPLLHKELPSIIERAHKNKICTVLTTNGLLLDRETANQLISCKLDVLYVSIDGASEETYRKYRVGGSFGKVIQNLKNMVAIRKERKSKTPFIEWQFIVFKHNEHEMSKAKKLAKELGVDHIVFLPAYTENADFEPSLPEFRLPDQSPLAKRSDCRHLWSTLSFHWNGTVVPCCYDYDEKTSYGNMGEDRLTEIWNNEHFKQSRMIIKNGNLQHADHLPCAKCVASISD